MAEMIEEIDAKKYPVLIKKQFKALEKIFASELPPQIPFQSKAKIYKELEEDGFCEEVITKINPFGQFPVTVTHWSLTLRGHYAYCSNC